MNADPRTLRSLIFLTVLATALAFACSPGEGTLEAMRTQASTQQNNCVTCHQTQSDGVVALFKSSIHGRTGKTCTSCHGGDGSANDKARAHSSRFVGQPSSNDILAMCGACHTNQLSVFKTSRHFPERRGSPRVDCVQCHGAHTVGSPSRNFSFAYYCAGCHGLEYLPHLPAELQKTLSMRDDLNDSIRALESSGSTLSSEALAAKKDLSRQIAGIVHATDSEGGKKKAVTIEEQIKAVSKLLEQKK